MTRPFKDIWFVLSAATLALFALFLLYPLLNVLSASLSAGAGGQSGWATLVNDPRYSSAVTNTLLLGAIVTVTSTLIGVPLAFVAARFSFPGKALIALLPMTTLIVPEVIAAQTWLMILGNNGFVTRAFAEWGIRLPSFYGWFGLITVMTFVYYTYVYIGTLAAIKGFDSQLEEASQSLGVPPGRTLLKVMVPVVAPSILASALLVFTLVVGNFAVATILGQRVYLLSVLTYQSFVSEVGTNPVMQSTLASVSIGIVACALFVQRWIVSRGRYEIVQGRGAKPSPLAGFATLPIALGAAFIMIVSLLPLVTIVAGAFTRARGPVMRWGEWTTANLERVFLSAPDPIVNTLIFAGIATVLSLLISTVVGFLVVKKRNALTPGIDYLSALPLALSGTVLGIGLMISFNGSFLPLAGTGAIIVVAYLIRRLPFGIRNASSTLYNIPNSIEDASISLGVPPLRSFFKVVFPLMLPSIAAAAVLVWTTTVAELSASVVVYSAGQETMPIQIFRLIDSNLMAQASAYGLVLVGVILIPILIATTVFKIDLFAAK
ncbi:MAG: iron ABC transporter permease [Alphaproteobacteria bacterium]|nr:iron ABC transporter permease [Alphaproteobacteria bacterium]